MSDQQQTLSIPSLLLLAAFTAITIRYFFFTTSSTTTPHTNPRTANPAHVEQIAAMFPQIGRREIIWDLQRNGGSLAATTERILSRGGLDAVGCNALVIDNAIVLILIHRIATTFFSATYTGYSDAWYGWYRSEPAEARICRPHYALQSQF